MKNKYVLQGEDFAHIFKLSKIYAAKFSRFKIYKEEVEILSDLYFLALKSLNSFDEKKGSFIKYFNFVARNYFKKKQKEHILHKYL